MKKILIILAQGFEDIEAFSVIDILRRCECDVTIAGLNSKQITSAHSVTIQLDYDLTDCMQTLFDAIILPGGEPGTTHLEASKDVEKIVKNHFNNQKLVGAICAAPRILEKYGLLVDKQATSYPGVKDKMISCNYLEQPVVVDGNLITSRGPATAYLFAFEILKQLELTEIANQVKKAMLFN
jgi:4-methyl-5(b-hydroxyethyl)-thiazole monophosphate biosynthesis